MNSEELGKGIQELKLNYKEEEQSQLQFTCFTELVNDVSLHFQIIRFPKQVFPLFKPLLLQLGHSQIMIFNQSYCLFNHSI